MIQNAQIAYTSLYSVSAPTSLARKRIWVMEDYLRTDDAFARCQQARLRYGGRQLRVMRFRYEKLAQGQRVCQLCGQPPDQSVCAHAVQSDDGTVEDERHIVLHCTVYQEERARLHHRLGTYAAHVGWAALDTSEEALCPAGDGRATEACDGKAAQGCHVALPSIPDDGSPPPRAPACDFTEAEESEISSGRSLPLG